jgi:hypothetical protein
LLTDVLAVEQVGELQKENTELRSANACLTDKVKTLETRAASHQDDDGGDASDDDEDKEESVRRAF